jgi:uncharacterized membrane protein YkvA (DUF1232 family)
MSWIKAWAYNAKRDVVALWLAARDPRTPWYVKLLAGAVAAYALSPIDLIPDFIPVLGYLDDLLLVPLGIVAAVALIPPELMREFRAEATRRANMPQSRGAAAVILALWTIALTVGAWFAFAYVSRAFGATIG